MAIPDTSEPKVYPRMPTRKVRRKNWYAKSASAFRWLHIYISMLSFAALMFFSFTGITLNHPTWFGASEQTVVDVQGELPAEFLVSEAESSPEVQATALQKVDKLGIAEWLRSEHRLKGKVVEFDVSEFEYFIVFKGPGYAADLFIDPMTGQYMLTETTTGLMAVLNDLHKGRDSGAAWSWVIDLSAVVMMLMSLSGFGLLFYLKKRRVPGLLTAVAGTIVLVVAWALWVP
ncbi:PepSY-associated TM helix [Planctomycetales bacterium 10988]|nr:PepSY-associated TM helix [Planctomycetales bacterium 10988]